MGLPLGREGWLRMRLSGILVLSLAVVLALVVALVLALVLALAFVLIGGGARSPLFVFLTHLSAVGLMLLSLHREIGRVARLGS